MEDKTKRATRHVRRLCIRYGVDGYDSTAFTGNFSTTGFFIHTNRVYKPGTRLRCEITTPSNALIHVEGTVMRAKSVPPQLVRAVRCGMGVHVHPSPTFHRLLRELDLL